VPLRCFASQPYRNWRVHKPAWNSLVRIGRHSSICSPKSQWKAFCMLLKPPIILTHVLSAINGFFVRD
jgi:hypothetical protein